MSGSDSVALIELTDAELDDVAGGQNTGLVVLDVNNVANNNQVQVAIPANVGAAVGILGTGTAVPTQLGNITNRR